MSNPAGFRFARPPALVVLALLSAGCVADTEGGRGDYGATREFQAATDSTKRPDVPTDCRSEWCAVHDEVPKKAPAVAILRDVVGERQAVEEVPVRAIVIPRPEAPDPPDPYHGVLLPDIKDQ